MRLSYYKRIFQAYLGGGASHLSFWHGDPEVNEAAFEPDSSQYYMKFFGKAHYSGPFDDEGIPMLDYRGSIGKQYNPIAIAQYGLGCWNASQGSGVRQQPVLSASLTEAAGTIDGESWAKRALCAADWLVSHVARNRNGFNVWHHDFDIEYFGVLKAPWYSGLAQGQGISLLTRAYVHTGCTKYLAIAESAFEAMIAPIDEGGCLYVDSAGDWWIEEYVRDPPTHIINGFMWAMWGVLDLAQMRGAERGMRDKARELWEKGVETLVKNIQKFDCGYWSLYDLAPVGMKNPASPFYHHLHLVQLEIMHRLTGNNVFRQHLERWAAYAGNRSYRIRAFADKVVFKLRYY